MQFLGKVAIGRLDIGLARIPRYPQNRIWISHLVPLISSNSSPRLHLAIVPSCFKHPPPEGRCSTHLPQLHKGQAMTTDPFTLFDDWYEQARLNEVNDSNAMALATADAQGRPSVRMVLLKGHGPDGFVFYTNYEGRKAADLFANPHAALLLHWKSMRRPIRIEGPGKQLKEEEGDAYFATRRDRKSKRLNSSHQCASRMPDS